MSKLSKKTEQMVGKIVIKLGKKVAKDKLKDAKNSLTHKIKK